jgi:hypothetical protein
MVLVLKKRTALAMLFEKLKVPYTYGDHSEVANAATYSPAVPLAYVVVSVLPLTTADRFVRLWSRKTTACVTKLVDVLK